MKWFIHKYTWYYDVTKWIDILLWTSFLVTPSVTDKTLSKFIKWKMCTLCHYISTLHFTFMYQFHAHSLRVFVPWHNCNIWVTLGVDKCYGNEVSPGVLMLKYLSWSRILSQQKQLPPAYVICGKVIFSVCLSSGQRRGSSPTKGPPAPTPDLFRFEYSLFCSICKRMAFDWKAFLLNNTCTFQL